MDDQKITVAQLLERIQQGYDRLNLLIESLDDETLARPSQTGWAIKDHLVHIAVWEAFATSLLLRERLAEADPVWQGQDQGLDESGENELIYRAYQHLSAWEARVKLAQQHLQTVEVVGKLSDEDLYRPYADNVPQAAGMQQAIIGWIIGNTYEHYEEHREYLKGEFGLGE